MRHEYQHHLSRCCEQHGFTLSEEQCERLAQYVQLLVQGRRHMNLTGLRDPERLIDTLVAESLDFFRGDFLTSPARVLDLGTGAGVPGVTLAVCEPRLHLTLLDRSQKKMTFLRRVVAALRLQNCTLLTASAEELAQRLRPDDRFDAVVARGVGSIALVLTLAAPLLRSGGVLLLRKPHQTPELEEAASLLATGAWQGIRTVSLPPSAHMAWVLLGITRSAGALD